VRFHLVSAVGDVGAAPSRAAYGSLSDYAQARAARSQASQALDMVTAALWPEDD
jgi:hypothetical protein